MKILLTGANGLIGRRIYEVLSKKNQVITVDKFHSNYNVDISIYQNLDEIIKNEKVVDVIIHCAALIGFNEFDENVVNVNITGTMNITRLAIELKCQHFIFISSVPIIGSSKGEVITTKTKDYPKTLYHISKLTGEYILNMYSNNMNICILRIASPVDINMPESRIVPLFLKKAKNNQQIYIQGKGKRIQTYINTMDIANCIEIIVANKIVGVHLLDGEEFSNYEIAVMCINATDSKSTIITDPFEIEDDSVKWIISCDFRKNCLKYELKFPLQSVLNEMKIQI